MSLQDRKQGAFGALGTGLARAFQWRLLVLWALGLLLPTLVAALPVHQVLGARLDHSVHVQAIAARFDIAWMFEVLAPVLQQSGAALNAAVLASLALALLLSPWLTGMVVASIRAGDTLRFGNLLQLGLREYGRMARMLLWSAIPLGVALAAGGAAMKWADGVADTAILANAANNASRVALAVLAIAFVLAHVTVEAGRAVLAADPSRRSAVKAWWRGVVLCARRPFAVLVVYLGTLLVGEGLALGLGFARTQVTAATPGGLLLGVLLVQLVVMALAWGRVARLYGLSALARDAGASSSARATSSRAASSSPRKRGSTEGAVDARLRGNDEEATAEAIA